MEKKTFKGGNETQGGIELFRLWTSSFISNLLPHHLDKNMRKEVNFPPEMMLCLTSHDEHFPQRENALHCILNCLLIVNNNLTP